MATLTILADRGEETIIPPPSNSFEISSVAANRCTGRNQVVNRLAYYEKIILGGDNDGSIPGGGGSTPGGDSGGKEGSGRKAAPPVPPSNTFKVGDIIYDDEALTILYSEGSERDFSINGGSFITLDKGSTVINQPCK